MQRKMQPTKEKSPSEKNAKKIQTNVTTQQKNAKWPEVRKKKLQKNSKN